MKINIHPTTYIFLLISFLSGYFEYMFLLLLIIIVHEAGHAIFGFIVGLNSALITIYPFGGLTTFNADLNTSIFKELFSLLGGIIFQVLFYLFCSYLNSLSFITIHVFTIIKRINYLLISFNFMPIIPLDGGKLLNILLDYFIPYKKSNMLSIYISLFFIIVFLLFNKTYYGIILTIFLIKSVIIEFDNISIKYARFLFERYKNNYKFKRIRIINNINSFKRDYTHIINNEFESSFLHKLFDRNI